MTGYLLQLDLTAFARRLSQSLGCLLNAADVREILNGAGSVEFAGGWLMNDLRPLMLVFLEPDCVGGDG
jgi:hypothetical protein